MSEPQIERETRSFANDIFDAARENPVAASVLGVGVVWLVSSMIPRRERYSDASVGTRLRRGSDAARETLAAAGSTIADSAAAAGHYISDATGSASRQFHDLSDAAARRMRGATADASRQAGEFGEAAGELQHQTMQGAVDTYRTARETIGALVDEQPLLLAAGGLIVGAAIAASLPSTDVERQTIGEAGKGLKAAAGGLVEEASARLSDAASAAANEARRQGVDPDALKDQAASLAERAKNVVSGADVSLPPRQGSPHRQNASPI